MEEIIKTIIQELQNIVINGNFIISILVGMFIIILESMIPILPLALFIAINMLVFGNVAGFFLSWIATIIGCTCSFYLFRYIKKYIPKKSVKKIENIIDKISDISFSTLVLILSMPFTPAFSINIGAGISTMSYRKYFCALCISKIFLVYFWGFIGTTFLESITDIGIIIKLVVMMLIAFLLSKFVMHKYDIR